MFQKILLALAAKLAKDFLRTLAQEIWNGLWSLIKECVKEAEFAWRESGQGAIREEYVIQKALDYLNKKGKMTKAKKWAVDVFLRKVVIRPMIADLNKALGKSWLVVVDDLQKYIEDKIPVIK